MAVYTISAAVDAQNIAIDLGDVQLVSGSDNIYQVSFTFSDEWDNFTKKVVFYTEWKKSIIEVLLSGTNIITIPTRSLAYSGFLRIGVYGTGTNVEKLPTVWSQKIGIYEGTCQGYENPPAPEPEVYDEILAAMAGKQDILGWNVADIGNAVKSITGNEYCMFTSGKYYAIPADNSAVSTTMTTNAAMSCAEFECVAGDVFTVNLRGSTSVQRGWAFLRSDRTVITKAASSNNAITREIVAPVDAKYLIVQTRNESSVSYYFTGYYAYKNRSLLQTINNINIADDIQLLEFKRGRLETGSVGSTVNWAERDTSTSTKISALSPIEEGDRLYINVGVGSASYRAYSITDANYKVLKVYGVNAVTGDLVVVAPTNAAYVAVNANDDDLTPYAIIKKKTVDIPQDAWGNVGMFTSIAVIGTSWDAGYFYSSISGSSHSYERRNRAWIKVLGNMYGIPSYNFGVVSGTTCLPDSSWVGVENAVSWQGDNNGLVALNASEVSRTLYFMDLVQNDAKKFGATYLGSSADIKEDYTQNPDTFYGNYARIIEQIKAKDQYARFVFCFKKGSQVTNIENTYADAVIELATHFGVPYINWLDDAWFSEWVYPHLVENHPVASDYACFAKAAERLFSNVMRHNWDYFKDYIPKQE